MTKAKGRKRSRWSVLLQPWVWLWRRLPRRGMVGGLDALAVGERLVTARGCLVDRGSPRRRISGDLVLDGEVLGTVVADAFRKDLTRFGDGHHAFVLSLPRDRVLAGRDGGLAALAGLRLVVRRTPEGPAAPFGDSPPRLRSAVVGSLDELHVGARELTATGWLFDQHDPELRVSAQVVLNGEVLATVVADRFRQGLEGRFGDGIHAFHARFPRPEGVPASALKDIRLASCDGLPVTTVPAVGFSGEPVRPPEPPPTAAGGKAFAAVRVPQLGRFGNAVVQCLNSLVIARDLGIPLVIWPAVRQFHPNSKAVGPLLARDIEAKVDGPVLADEEGFFGHFLHPDMTHLAPWYYPEERGRELRAPAVIDALVASHLRPSINYRCFEPVPAVGPDDLVLHVRAGDLFRGSLVHPAYAQPPLAFYLLALTTHRAEFPAAQVHLVFEDRGNPVVGAISAHCAAHGVPLVVHSSPDLLADLRVLLSAGHLAGGCGSFVAAAALVSQQPVRTFWLLRDMQPFITDVLRHRGTRVRQVVLREPYIGDRDWRNTPEQRKLMVEFPLAGAVIAPE